MIYYNVLNNIALKILEITITITCENWVPPCPILLHIRAMVVVVEHVVL